MSCRIFSDSISIELYVTSWSTTLSSSLSPVIAQSTVWFEAWQPSQDTINLTVRQPSARAQAALIQTLHQWIRSHQQLTLIWDERNIDSQVVVKSAPQNLDYTKVIVDLNLSLLMLTNSFYTAMSAFTVSKNALGMLGSDFVTSDIEDLTNKNSDSYIVRNAINTKQQWTGYTIKYISGDRMQISWNVSHTNAFTGKTTTTTNSYIVPVTADFIKKLNSGYDVKTWLESRYKQSSIGSEVANGDLPFSDLFGN